MITRRHFLGALGTAVMAPATVSSCADTELTARVSAATTTVVPSGGYPSTGPFPSTLTRPLQAPVAAASFVDSVGVNAHWTYLDTPYGHSYDDVRALLVASGIRHVRTYMTDRAADLAEYGIGTNVLIDSDQQGRGDPVQMLNALAPLASSGAVVAVEGPNECDQGWPAGHRTYRGQPFPQGPVLWQKAMWDTVRSDPRLHGLTVIGPSLGGTYWGGGMPYAPGTFEAMCDWGNFHPYPGGNPYTDQYAYAGIAQYYKDSDFPSAALDVHPLNLEVYRPPFGDRPMCATETGYSTWKWGQNLTVQGKYVPRLFAENFRLGITRTYLYEFLDLFDDPAGATRDSHFGLLHNDLTPKPAYRAVKAMLGAVGSDRAAGSVAPADLGATITVRPPSGYDPAATHHLTLQRRDGTVVVVVWHEVSSDDTSGLLLSPQRPVKPISHPPVGVTLTFRSLPRGASATYLTDAGRLADASVQVRGSAVSFVVGDRLTFVTIPPAA